MTADLVGMHIFVAPLQSDRENRGVQSLQKNNNVNKVTKQKKDHMIGKVNGAAITGMTLRPKTVLAVLPLTGRRDEEGKDQIL